MRAAGSMSLASTTVEPQRSILPSLRSITSKTVLSGARMKRLTLGVTRWRKPSSASSTRMRGISGPAEVRKEYMEAEG